MRAQADAPAWRKSSKSGGGNCLEVAILDGVLVRDSKQSASDPRLRFAGAQWALFTTLTGAARVSR
ncbi:DUF397 domain-containing protein [Embleya sp. NBC_00888]|uniref:DUF397 domain-containing protein n=1 Tax=Embleya sp. NBC_00888 TaxID=2975960 RepID=UPI00386B066E|nr:DUF397 domain-containing protein [Embleya sp. NBC_00888]